MAKFDGASRADPAAKSAPPSPVTASRAGRFARTHTAAGTANGCRILAKRFRTPHGEIDIVAKRRNLFAFVELKGRATFDEAVRGDVAAKVAHDRCRASLADGAFRAWRIRTAF